MWGLLAVVLLGVVVAVGLFTSVGFLTDGTSILVTAYDVLAPVDKPVRLRVKLQSGPVLRDAVGVRVTFRLPDAESVSAVTDKQGVAAVEARFDAPGDLTVPLTVPRRFRSAKSEDRRVRVFVRPADVRVAVSDVDHTLADVSAAKVLQTPNDQTPVLPGSADVLTRLAETHLIVYLTARDDKLLNKTRDWLALHGYPAGPLFGRDLGVDSLSAEKFKTQWLTALRSSWPGVAIGFGDRDEDGRAYHAAGIPSHIVRPQPFKAGALPDSAHHAKDWAEISARVFGEDRPASSPHRRVHIPNSRYG